MLYVIVNGKTHSLTQLSRLQNNSRASPNFKSFAGDFLEDKIFFLVVTILFARKHTRTQNTSASEEICPMNKTSARYCDKEC